MKMLVNSLIRLTDYGELIKSYVHRYSRDRHAVTKMKKTNRIEEKYIMSAKDCKVEDYYLEEEKRKLMKRRKA